MRYLKISNKGLLDPNLIPLMGGTTKSGKDTIGEFGTGLKYALAYCVRNNITLRMFIDKKEVQLTSVKQTIAGQEFNIIYINGEKTSITDKMGKDWSLWMIIREIYSNALDEGEAYYEVVNSIEEDKEGRTCFYIEFTYNVVEIYNNWINYFIHSKQPIWENNVYKIYPQEGNFKIYKQGILIHEDDKLKSFFSYDLKHAEINELRQYQGHKHLDIARVLSNIDDVSVIEMFLDKLNIAEREQEKNKKGNQYVEQMIDLEWGNSTFDSTFWDEALENTKIIDIESYNKLKNKSNVDLSDMLILPTNFFKRLLNPKKRKAIGAVRTLKEVGSFFEIMSDTLFNKVKKARKILQDVGYFIHPELNFIFGEFGSKTTFAKVDFDEKMIYISSKCENISMFQMIAILIEENEHFQTGYADETRAFQQHFIDLYTKQLLENSKVEL